MKRLLTCTLVLAFILTGCNSNNEDKSGETVCKNEQNKEMGIIETNTVYYKNDAVNKVVINNTFDLNNNSLAEEDLSAYAESIKETYSNIEGVTYEYTSTETEFNEVITIELTAETFQKIKESGLLSNYYGSEDEALEAKAMIKLMEEKGMTCK